MASEWQEYPLADCMDAILDYRGKTPKKTDSGIPLITAKIIKGGTILPVTEFIAEDDYDAWMCRGLPQPGDIVMTTEAPLGEIARLDNRKIALAQRVITLRGKKGILDNGFLKYLMLSHYVQHQLDGRGTGTTVTGIKQSELRQINLKFPSFVEQKAIAHILGSLDDKIELNRQMNATLEAMAQALFKSWFVDFDPVIDNALAAGNPIPDELEAKAAARQALGDARKPLPEEIRSLFPNAFVFTEEMGWIPAGWEIGVLEDHCEIIMGQSPKGESYNVLGIGTPLVNGPVEFGEYFTERMKWTTEPTKYSKNNDLIVCVRGSTTGRYVKSDGVYCLGRGVCALRGKYSQAFVDQFFKSSLPDFLRYTTGSTFPSWNTPTIKAFLSIKPAKKVVDRFDKKISSILDKQGELTKSNVTLSNLRDTLLPKLLSGELRIPEAERLVEEAIA